MKLRLVMVGKTRRAEVRALLNDYLDRIRHYSPIEITELRDAGSAAAGKLACEPGTIRVLLDAAGKQFTSEEFARWLAEQRDRGTRELIFLCGGAEGFPGELRQRAQARFALSTLTMSHELARVVLAEQIYRAYTVLAGHPYAK